MSELSSLSRPESLQEQFDDLEQQHQTATFGMWIFLATEVLFFGGLFLTYTVYRSAYPADFARAGKELNITIGTLNTAVLLISSAFMAFAVDSARKNQRRKSAVFLATTWCLGFLFLALKAYEYWDDFKRHIVVTNSVVESGARPEVARLLYLIYYLMTGLHAIHMMVGLGLVAVIFKRTLRSRYSENYYSPVEATGLYWHFVDVIWIFLYPLFYLMDRYS